MQTGMYNCNPNPSLPPSNPFSSFYLTLVFFFPLPIVSPPPISIPFNSNVYFRSPPSPWMVFLIRRSIVVNHWSRRDIESNSLTASVNASLFCSSCASRSFCCHETGVIYLLFYFFFILLSKLLLPKLQRSILLTWATTIEFEFHLFLIIIWHNTWWKQIRNK